MVEGVAYDGVVLVEQCAEEAAVGIEARAIENGVVGLEVVGYGSLKFLVDVLRAAYEAHARHAVAALFHHLHGSVDEARVVAQAQVVVGAEVEHVGLGLHLDGGSLWGRDQSFFLVEAGSLGVGEFLLQMLLNFTVHDSCFIL